jgi:hypothetical protein
MWRKKIASKEIRYKGRGKMQREMRINENAGQIQPVKSFYRWGKIVVSVDLSGESDSSKAIISPSGSSIWSLDVVGGTYTDESPAIKLP